MNVCIDGKSKGTVASKDLCDAFAGIYLDSKTVSPSLKKDIASTMLVW